MANVPRNGILRVAEAKLTALVGIAGLLILLSARSDYPDLFGRYSWRYAAVLVAYALIMLGATITRCITGNVVLFTAGGKDVQIVRLTNNAFHN